VIQPASPKRRERERKKKERKKKTRTKEKQQEKKKKKKKKRKPGLLSSYSPPDAPNGKNTGTAPPPSATSNCPKRLTSVESVRLASRICTFSLSLSFLPVWYGGMVVQCTSSHTSVDTMTHGARQS